jgi:hypothetical protein
MNIDEALDNIHEGSYNVRRMELLSAPPILRQAAKLPGVGEVVVGILHGKLDGGHGRIQSPEDDLEQLVI